MRRFREVMAKRLDETTAAAQQNIPGQNIKNQISGAQLPPGGPVGTGYPSAPHTHPLEDLEQSGATDGQVVTWSDAEDAYIPADPSGGGGSLTITDGVTTVTGVNDIALDGATIDDDGGGAVTLHITGASADAVTTPGGASIPGLAGSPDRAGSGTLAEEYDSAATGLTWTPSTPATVDSDTTIPNHLYIETTDGTERFGTRAYAPVGAFDIRAKVTMAGLSSGQTGLLVGDSSLSNFVLVNLEGNNSGVPFVRCYTYNGSYTQRGSALTIAWNLYVRLSRDGSNNVTFYASADGLAWVPIATQSFTFTAAKAGYRVGNAAHVAVSDWLRGS